VINFPTFSASPLNTSGLATSVLDFVLSSFAVSSPSHTAVGRT